MKFCGTGFQPVKKHGQDGRATPFLPRIGQVWTLAVLLIFALSAFHFPLSALAVDDVEPPEIAGVRVGFDGCYKAGLWTPVEITLRGDVPPDAEMVLTVPDGDGVRSQVVVALKDAKKKGSGSDGQQSVLTYVRFGRVRGELTVAIRHDGEIVAERVFQAGGDVLPEAKPSETRVLLSIAPGPMGVVEAVGVLARTSRDTIAAVRLDDCSRLPDRWYGYEAIDTVILSTSDADFCRALESNAAGLAALGQWIRMGGRLVFCVGREAESVLRPGGPLADFAPGRLDKMISLPRGDALEAYAGSEQAIPSATRGRLNLHAGRLVDVEGRVDARDGDLPLVVRRAMGFGEIAFLAADLDVAPISDWSDRGRLVAELLGGAAEGGELKEGAAVLHYGYTDMAGQLRSTLDRFEGVRPVPFSLVVGLIVLYVLMIGPGDYFLLRKLLRRMELTWITFPLSVVVMAAAAYLLAGQFKGDRVRVNQMSLVDVDTTSGLVRGTSWANFFSPAMDRYDVTFSTSFSGERKPAHSEMLSAWLGLPGSALGGMDPKTVDPGILRGEYRFAPGLDAMLGMPVPQWSTRSATARWIAETKVDFAAELAAEGQLVVGTIRNGLDFPLHNAVLVYGRWAYPLETIEPGGAATVGSASVRRELRTLLVGQMEYDPVTGSYIQKHTVYDRASTDPAYVLRAMAFFDAAGGRRYTGLYNRYQEFVDLSHLLRTDRAVLMADLPTDAEKTSGARLVCNGELIEDNDPHPTVMRFVLPVGKE